MQADLKLKDRFESKIAEVLLSVDRVLDVLKQQQPEVTLQMALDTKEHIRMMVSLKLMQQELKEKQEWLSSYWLVHKARLEHVTHVCQLIEKMKEVCS